MLSKSPYLNVCVASIVATLLASCSHFRPIVVDKSDAPDDDSDYFEVYEDFTRDVQIYSNFATRYHLSATFMSGEFRQAYSKRHQSIYDSEQPGIVETSDKTGFFVTIFSPDPNLTDLNDELLWTIKLKTEENELKPSLVKRLSSKSRWEPFFVNVNKWTHEYLVLFDAPSTEISKNLVEKKSISLTFANADARVKLSW